MNAVGPAEHSLGPGDVAELKVRYGSQRVWAVVSTFAADAYYRGLTYTEAVELVKRETREPGRTASVVLEIEYAEGVPL
jgi:hypothetical protein